MMSVLLKPGQKIFFPFLLCAALLASACSSALTVSDDEAVRILEQHYIFYEGGKQIKAAVVGRKAYDRECECLPVEFEISGIDFQPVIRTYYFFRDRSGEIDVRKFKYGIKGT